MSSKVYSLHSKRFQSSHCSNIVEKGKKKGRRRRKGEEEGRTGNVSPLSLPLHFSFLLSSQLSRPTVQITIFCPNKKISHVCLRDSKMPAGQQNHGHYYFIIIIIFTSSINYAMNYDSSVFTTGLFSWRWWTPGR